MFHSGKPSKGKFYVQFDGETWEEAVGSHAVGFETVGEAIQAMESDGHMMPDSERFVVKDDKENVLFDSKKGKV